MEISDNELIKNYLSGDKKSLDILFGRYLKLIYNFAWRFGNDRDLAEDIASEVFIKVWQNLNKFDLTKNFKTWIYTIAHHTIIDFFRKNKKEVSFVVSSEGKNSDLLETVADKKESVENDLKKRELKKELENFLLNLDQEERTIILLYYNQELTFKKIAKILQKPLNTVKSRYRRALLKLRKLLKMADFK